jgi:lysophospholipase
MKHFILLCLMLPAIALGIPEEDLAVEWNKKIIPHFETMTTGTINNPQGLKLKYFFHKRPGNKKSLVIVPGRTEPAIKYAELIYDLRDSGLNIYIMDHQGQGASDRILSDSQKGHVVLFENYVDDLAQFNKEVVDVHESGPRYILAHSMGGAIAAQYMSKYQKTFTKAVLTSPMFSIDSKPFPETIARLYSSLLVKTKKGENYAPGNGLYYGPYVAKNNTFEKNMLTHSVARFGFFKELFETQPSLIVNGPTSRWAYEALKATRNIDGLNLETPVLLFQAGSDLIVKPSRQNSFCRKGNCELIKYPAAAHEIFMENDGIRDEAIKETKLFFGI